MSKFTARQWEYAERSGVIFAEDKGIAKVYGASTLMRDYTCDGAANARLIASAPAMYELVEKVAALSPDLVMAPDLVGDVVLYARELLERIDGEDEAECRPAQG